MRIGMMADIYKTQVSGVTNTIALIKRWLEKEGHEVFVFTFGDDEIIDNEKNIIRTTGVPVVDTGIYLNLRYNRQARHLLYTMDIAHVHHPFVSGSLAMRYCVPRNIPVVFTNHTRYDLLAQAYLPILPDTIGDAALKAYLSPFYRACDLVIVPSPSMRQVLEEHFGLVTPVEVIPNGLDLTPYRADIQPIDRSLFGFSTNDVVSIYVGRLSPEKNLSLLLRAFYGVAMTYDHVRLLVVGDGPERENLEAQVKHMNIGRKVYFTGMVEYKEIPGYLATSDIFVTPSSAETFGLSTVEAMAAGLPTLGIDAPGTGDIIEDGITGLVTTDDLAVFTAKLVLLSTNHELRKVMGRQAVQESKNYDIQTTTSILVQHYQQLVEKSKRRKKGVYYKLNRFLDRFQ
ncbi:MAG: glycosyltransferase [Anaerolineales bacterium]|jgi:glycosyltransferase involved in cell wall biosynthesis